VSSPLPDSLPDNFTRTIAEVFGERGLDWLRHLPALLDECQRRWSLTLQRPFELSYNYVAPAVRADGVEVVVKAGVPHPELFSEMAALKVYDGRGSVRLLDSDAARGVMLLERLRPGRPLVELPDDEQATRIAAQVMRQLWRPVPNGHSFPTVNQWAEGMRRLRRHFDGGTGPLSPRLVETAERLFDELLNSMAERVVLHGDLHHWNILSAERTPPWAAPRPSGADTPCPPLPAAGAPRGLWLALDPKGIVGEPAYEVGALLRNPIGQLLNRPHPERVTARRVDLLAEMLGFDRARMVGWGLAQAVLSAWWSIEDHGHGWEEAMACAEMMEAML
jgi:streptomycin 6-kinase